MIRIIAKRYAKALADLSEEKKIVDKTREDLSAFVSVVEAQQDIQKLFVSPVFTPEDRKAVIREISSRLKFEPSTERFIEYLAEAGRIRYVREVYHAFEDLLAERQNRAALRLTTASPINNGDIAELRKRFEAITGKNVDIEMHVDPAVIGGAKAQIGSVIYDGTVKNQLDKMRQRLMENTHYAL